MVKQMKPSDIPEGVITSKGVDMRGPCYNFIHTKYGKLGKVVVISVSENKTMIQSDIYNLSDLSETDELKRQEIFHKVVLAIDKAFNENFPD